MIYDLCPGCLHINPVDALWCEGCGISLARGDTVPQPLQRAAAPPVQHAPGVLWLDDLRGASWPTAPLPSGITLRELDAPPRPPLGGEIWPATSPSAPAMPAPAARKAPQLPRSLRTALPPAWTPETPAPPPPHLPPVAVQPVEELVVSDPAPRQPAALDRSASRDARRAVVRRKRIAHTAEALSAVDTVPEVLVVDPDATARGALCDLLRAFGFGVRAVGTAADAEALLLTQRFEAVFADIALDSADGGAGIELCHDVRRCGRRLAGEPTLMVLVTRALRPVERVRAELAGCDEILVKPAQRGDVARALDTRGVPWPADARRG